MEKTITQAQYPEPGDLWHEMLAFVCWGERMIIGEYPCCNGSLWIPLATDRPLPCFEREECPHCGAIVWHQHSRVDPQRWTEEGFLKEYSVDPVTKHVTLIGSSHAERK